MTAPSRIVVAMSGGVDSSVAAALLRDQGHQVEGATLLMVDDPAGAELVERAETVAHRLGLSHHVVRAEEAFERHVLLPSWNDYQHGRTPNPCVLCNRHIKLGLLVDWAREQGVDRVATGHYATIHTGPSGPVLGRGRDRGKDQSYFLAAVERGQLEAARFPLGAMTKAEVRAKAHSLGLTDMMAPESQDTCIVTSSRQSFAEVLRGLLGGTSRPGPIVTTSGEALGHHQGIHRFTIGQRRGLQVSLGRPGYVCHIDGQAAKVVVTADEDRLHSTRLRATSMVWQKPAPDQSPLCCQVQIRYRHRPAQAQAVPDKGGTEVEITFDQPQLAVTPGQRAVLYDDEQRVVGSGVIDRAIGEGASGDR